MIYETSLYYLSEEGAVEDFMEKTGLALDEIESIVGRFSAHSERSGKLRGEVRERSGKLRIVHHFNKKEIWSE